MQSELHFNSVTLAAVHRKEQRQAGDHCGNHSGEKEENQEAFRRQINKA
jgi:hypothetical protein